MAVLGITMGDPAGVGPEILSNSLEFLASLSIPVIIYGSVSLLDYYGAKASFLKDISEFNENKGIYIKDFPLDVGDIQFGKVSLLSGRFQYALLRDVVKDIKRKKIDGVVTLPINKEAISLAGFSFPGHTEFFASSFNVADFAMMLANSKVKVVLETTHVPFKKVPHLLSEDSIYKKIKLVNRYFPQDKIAVAALNPHGGEGGLFGDEEIKIIKPAVDEARKEGILVDGPFPADTLFCKVLNGEFDTVICMYHDQGLIPVKLTGFEEVVNITLGLPFVRTSVGHGTAYDIVGKGTVSNKSFISAVKYATKLLKG